MPGRDEEKPASQRLPASGGTRNPGDESRPGAPQTGEQICPACVGSGRTGEGPCDQCGGSGRVIVIVGDA
jgi:DnaJ-class molecular chaperone